MKWIPAGLALVACLWACTILAQDRTRLQDGSNTPLVVNPQGQASPDDIRLQRETYLAMYDQADALADYTCVFTKMERIDGDMQPLQTTLLKQRKSPRALYMRWIADPYKDRECILYPAKHGPDLLAHAGSPPASWFGLVHLSPTGSIAMRGQLHPATHAGLYYTFDMIRMEQKKRTAEPGQTFGLSRVEKRLVHGQPSICFLYVDPKYEQKGFYGPVSELCIHERLHLPTSTTIWDEDGNLVETYTYRDYQINTGLTDRDFDPENPEYDF